MLASALAAVALAGVGLYSTPALAADLSTTQITVTDILSQLDQLQVMQVEEDVCAKCHASYDPDVSFAAEIKFSHGYHVRMQCGDCHTAFPHQKSGTQRPTMRICMNCHGLRHGPQGEIAKANCDACHVTPKSQLSCPGSRTPAWAGKGHVAKASADATKDCMMCHQQSDCVTCHQQRKIVWAPKDGWAYDPGEAEPKSGCYSCHANSTLLAPALGANKSFQVTGVSDSAHYKLTCQQCHPDFRYDATPSATKLWNVNAGMQCATCHQGLTDKRLSAPVAEYEKSTHARQVRNGNLNAATCASCHGSHYIKSLKSVAERGRLHGAAESVCAGSGCHADKFDSFDDYYHGQPYKSGAPDAPACWQCHGSHGVLAHQEDASMVNPVNMGKTCGQPGCHKGSTEKFADQASQLIHRKVEANEQNLLVQQIARLKGVFGLQ
jgi:hypothetical protein